MFLLFSLAAVGARRTSGGRGSTGFLEQHVSCHISRENHDSMRHIAGRFNDGSRHPPQPKQNKKLEFSRATLDARRLEVVVDGLPLHGGAQLAVDTILVSAWRR